MTIEILSSLMLSRGWKHADRVMLASGANMADRDPAKHMVVISRGEGEGRIERKLKNEFVKFQFEKWVVKLFSIFNRNEK